MGWRIGDPQPYASSWYAREPVPVPLENVQAVEQGQGPGCAIVAPRPVEGTIHGKDPAQVWCWGEGFEYGKGMTGRGFVPSTKPMLLWEGPDLDDMSVGYRNVCLLHDEGTVTCFGYTPRFGQWDKGVEIVEQRGLVEVDAGWTNTCMKPRKGKWFCV